MLTDEKIRELFNMDAFNAWCSQYGTNEVIDWECFKGLVRVFEKQVQLETIEKLKPTILCDRCAFSCGGCLKSQDECISNLMTLVRGEG